MALSRRVFSGTAPMDPELSFLMANLASVGTGSLILDPFAGEKALSTLDEALLYVEIIGLI